MGRLIIGRSWLAATHPELATVFYELVDPEHVRAARRDLLGAFHDGEPRWVAFEGHVSDDELDAALAEMPGLYKVERDMIEGEPVTFVIQNRLAAKWMHRDARVSSRPPAGALRPEVRRSAKHRSRSARRKSDPAITPLALDAACTRSKPRT